MKSIFEPLLHANARVFAVLGGILFLAMLGWSLYAEYEASRQAGRDAEASAQVPPPPSFPPHERLGILDYIETQTAPGSEANHLPVDLFRPPVDDEGNPVRPGTTLHLQKTEGGNAASTGGQDVPEEIAKLVEEAQQNMGGNGGGRPGGRWPGGGGPGRPGSAGTPDRTLRYAGVFKRSDGTLAAWVSDSAGGGSFATPGAEVAGATILDGGDTDHLRIRLPDGTEATLERGGEPVIVEAGKPAQPGTDDGSNRRRQRRMPTEEEIAEIAKRDPELANRIREAIKRRAGQ